MDYTTVVPISGPVASRKQAAKRHYGTHPYFTRRSWDVVQNYISTFSAPDDLVLDPFGGSGVTAVEALVLGRRGVQLDISPLANFIADCTAVAPVDLAALTSAFSQDESECREPIRQVYAADDELSESTEIPFWYPSNVPLPSNADVRYVHELFTRRQLFSLAMLHHHISEIKDGTLRKLLMFAFSATLAKTNRTFVSATGRKESRGGSTIFSIYRYYVPPSPVKLQVWDQFEMRFKRLLVAKREINDLVDGRYSPDTFRAIRGSATDLKALFPADAVDYIFTDPPYGAHIAYLDLTTMWDAWLGFDVTERDKKLEVIEGGNLAKSKQEYVRLLESSIDEMARVLKWNRWLSLVFSHKDPPIGIPSLELAKERD